MRILKRTLMSVATVALLCPLAGQAQGGRDAYSDVRIVVKDLSNNEEIGEVNPGGSFDLPEGSKVRLIMRLYASGQGGSSRPIYPRTQFTEGTPGRGGVRITATNEMNANATLEVMQLRDNASQRQRSELIRYQISDPEGRIPDRLERGSFIINVDNDSSWNQGQDSTSRRAEELTRALYRGILMREPDEQGARSTIRDIQRGGYNALIKEAVDIANSDESRIRLYERDGVCNEKRLLSLYKNVLGVDSSRIDRRQWDADLRRMNNGELARVVEDMVRSDRFRSRYSLNVASY
ncbi:MAG TPA: hypothetical protein VJ725_15705 [Thermoanaerobaculia bacterium]|nr:hypothetical protein [Thermoanaerobaculia bacterium]